MTKLNRRNAAIKMMSADHKSERLLEEGALLGVTDGE